ncbi:protein of unknown function [Tepidibacter aestuarii]|nr:protein of unknown function [Tepidibacter aestuarii]
MDKPVYNIIFFNLFSLIFYLYTINNKLLMLIITLSTIFIIVQIYIKLYFFIHVYPQKQFKYPH